MKIHIGSGGRILPGYISVDADPSAAVDYTALASELPFENDVANIIYACHVLEHIPRPYVMATLTEWRRVLRPGGIVRISVPDFEVLSKLYLEEQIPLWRIIGSICGRQNTKYNHHYTIWDYHYLAWHLTQTGFYDIRRWDAIQVHPSDYDDYSLAWLDDRFISLNIEATAK